MKEVKGRNMKDGREEFEGRKEGSEGRNMREGSEGRK